MSDFDLKGKVVVNLKKLNELEARVKKIKNDFSKPFNIKIMLGDTNKKLDRAAKRIEKLTKEINGLKKVEIKVNSDDLNTTIKEVGEIKRGLGSLRRLSDVDIKIQTDFSEVDDATRALDEQKDKINETAKATKNLASANKALLSAGIGASLVSAVGIGVKENIVRENQLADVARVLEVPLKQLDTMDLAFRKINSVTPITYKELSEIAKIAAQIGIAQENIAGFSEIISRFSSVTDMPVEAAANDIAVIGNILRFTIPEYKKFVNASMRLGNTFAATEPQVLEMAKSISGVSKVAGFATEDIVAFSAAFPSLGIAPELARGGIQDFFRSTANATRKGGEELENFAKIIGATKQETEKLIKTDPAQFFAKFVHSLKGKSNEDILSILKSVEISNKRVMNMISLSAVNPNAIVSALKQSKEVYASSEDILKHASDIKFDTVASQFEVMVNQLKNAASSLGKDIFTNLGAPIKGINTILRQLESPIGRFTLKISSWAVLFTGVRLGVKGFTQTLKLLGGSFTKNIVSVGRAALAYRAESLAMAKNSADKARNTKETIANAAAKNANANANNKSALSSLGETVKGMGSAAVGAMTPMGWVSLAAGGIATIVSLVSAFKSMGDSSVETRYKVEELFNSMGGKDTVIRALERDMESFLNKGGKAFNIDVNEQDNARSVFAAQKQAIDNTNKTIGENVDILDVAKISQMRLNEEVRKGTKDSTDYGIVIGESMNKILSKLVVESPEFENIVKTLNKEVGEGAGNAFAIGFKEASEKGKGIEYITNLANTYKSKLSEMKDSRNDFTVAMLAGGVNYNEVSGEEMFLANLANSFKALGDTMKSTEDEVAENSILNNTIKLASMKDYINYLEDAQIAVKDLFGVDFSIPDNVTYSVNEAVNKMKEGIDSLADSANQGLNIISENNQSFIEGYSLIISEIIMQGNQALMQDADFDLVSYYDESLSGLANMLHERFNVPIEQAVELGKQMLNSMQESKVIIDADNNIIMGKLNEVKTETEVVKEEVNSINDIEIDINTNGIMFSLGQVIAKAFQAKEAVALIGDGGSGSGGLGKKFEGLNKKLQNKGKGSGKALAKGVLDGVSKGLETLPTVVDNAKDNKKGGGGGGGGKKGGGGGGKKGGDKKDKNNFKGVMDDVFKDHWKTNKESEKLNKNIDKNKESIKSFGESSKTSLTGFQEKVKDITADLAKLKAEADINEHFAEIAGKYGDTLRQNKFKAEADKNRADMAKLEEDKEKQEWDLLMKGLEEDFKKFEELQKSIEEIRRVQHEAVQNQMNNYGFNNVAEKATGSLKESNGELKELQKNILGTVDDFAKSGASVEEVTKKLSDARKQFIEEAKAKGFNIEEINKAAEVFDKIAEKMGVILKGGKSNIKVDDNGTTKEVEDAVYGMTQKEYNLSVNVTYMEHNKPAGLAGGGLVHGGFASGGLIPGIPPANKRIDNRMGVTRNGNLIPIQSGEYVIKKQAVDHYGIAAMNKLNNMQTNKYPPGYNESNNGSSNSNAPQKVILLPEQIEQLAKSVSTVINLDGEMIANSTANHYAKNNARGV